LFTVQEIVTPRSDLAWTPQSAQIVLLAPKSARTVLHSFAGPADRDRVVLPAGAPSCDVEGDVVFAAQQLEKGQILVTDQPLKSVLAIAQQRGAAAVFSASLESYNRDPTGRERHLDAIQYQSVPHGTTMPVAQISPRSMAVIKQAQGSMPGVRLAFKARVAWSDRPLRTLVATIAGRRRAEQAVALAAHVQEPGACDNASGVGGMTEAAVCLAESIRGGRLPRPERTLVFLWGNEMDQTRIWLEKTDHKVVAGIAIDMIGESATQTGAIALLERSPDPGALSPLAPDVHTTWGAGEVDEQTIVPNGLAVIARCALADVARLEKRWSTAEHPWEGGSDHDVFLERGVPAILFWHFPDFAYHTSLDRLEHVDPTEVRRMSVAALATALSLTSPSDGDLSRYLATLDREQSLRLRAAEQVQDTAISEQWRQWCHQSGEWLRETCAVLERRD
jgi:hypothetical protein